MLPTSPEGCCCCKLLLPLPLSASIPSYVQGALLLSQQTMSTKMVVRVI